MTLEEKIRKYTWMHDSILGGKVVHLELVPMNTVLEVIQIIEKRSRELCYAIEELPASEQQTKISIMASNLLTEIK